MGAGVGTGVCWGVVGGGVGAGVGTGVCWGVVGGEAGLTSIWRTDRSLICLRDREGQGQRKMALIQHVLLLCGLLGGGGSSSFSHH